MLFFIWDFFHLTFKLRYTKTSYVNQDTHKITIHLQYLIPQHWLIQSLHHPSLEMTTFVDLNKNINNRVGRTSPLEHLTWCCFSSAKTRLGVEHWFYSTPDSDLGHASVFSPHPIWNKHALQSTGVRFFSPSFFSAFHHRVINLQILETGDNFQVSSNKYLKPPKKHQKNPPENVPTHHIHSIPDSKGQGKGETRHQ